MTDEQYNLLRECHEMLTEIATYIRKVQSPEYRENEDTKQFCINAVANIFVDGMEENSKDEIKGNFKNKSV